MKVLVIRSRLAELLEKQENLLPDSIEFVVPEIGDEEELVQLAKDVEIIVCTRISEDVVKAAKKLKFIQKTGAGVDAIPFNVIPEDVYVANTSGANPRPMAEGAIGMIFALAKKIVYRHNLFPERSAERGVELYGKKVGIIGLGAIGVEVAKKLQAFGMNILAIKRQPEKELKEELKLEYLGSPDDLNHVLRESDFVVVTTPLTPATRGMIGAQELGLMKPTAYIVNIARAAIIQEEPLYNALKENQIAGAALDVWWIPHWWDPKWKPEIDKPSRYPIWELPNVIVTPHNIGFTKDSAKSGVSVRIMAENIGRIAEGKVPIKLVDKEHEY